MELKTLYFSGGQFQELQEKFDKLKGVEKTVVGFAQSLYPDITYDRVHSAELSDAVETVRVEFDTEILTMNQIVNDYFNMIDPTNLFTQGQYKGAAYRAGIYSEDKGDIRDIKKYINDVEQPKYNSPIQIEVEELENFTLAESKYQK